MNSVYNSIIPIIKVSSVLGLLSIRFVKDNAKINVQFNKPHILLPATYMGITAFQIYEVILSPATLEKSKYGIGTLYIGALFIFTGNISALYTIYFVNTLVSTYIAKAINKISKADELMKIMVNKIDHQSHFKYEMYIITGSLLVVLTQIILHYITFNSQQKLLNARVLFLLAFPIIIRMVLEFQYTMLVKLLHERFIVLNTELYSLFEYKCENCKRHTLSIQTLEKSNWKGWITEEPKFIATQLRNVELFMTLYDTLTEAGNMISRVYSVQILACFSIYLINEIFTIFYAYFEMVHHNYIPALHWFGWIIVINLGMIQITTICHRTTNEASKTASLINKLFMEIQLNKVVKDKLFIFFQQIQHRPLKFSACGLFAIDGGLLFMVACSSSTYLLLMFQHQKGIEMHCLNKNAT